MRQVEGERTAMTGDDCTIDNSNRLLIRTVSEMGGKKKEIDLARELDLVRYFRGLSSPFFFSFFSSSFADRARTHEVYFGYTRHTAAHRHVPRRTESEINSGE